MPTYALIVAGAVAEYREYPEALDLATVKQAGGKPVLRLVVDVLPGGYDADTQTLGDPAIVVGDTQVTRTYAARNRTSDEWATVRELPRNGIEAEYQARAKAPVVYLGHTWHADDEAVQNIMGVVLLIAAGVPVPNPRPWTPVGSLTPVDLTHAQLIGLGAAIAARKDALFVIKKEKQGELAALESVAAIHAYDAAAGWDD